MSNQRRSHKIRQATSARSMTGSPGSPASPVAAFPDANVLTDPGTGRKETAAGRSHGSHNARVPLAVAVITATASIAAAGVNGLLNHAGTHSPQPSAAASATTPATPRALSSTPVASAVPLPASPLVRGDNSAFMADITYPDGTKVPEGQSFIKKWEIKNIGSAPWIGRYLEPDGKITGACTYPPRVPVPAAYPGKPVIISVPVVAPGAPQVCFVTWKMVNAAGDLYFPNEEGMWFNVKIVAPGAPLPAGS